MHREALTEAESKLLPSLAAFDDFYLAGGTALALQIVFAVWRLALYCERLASQMFPRGK
jgi:hypothetical protein